MRAYRLSQSALSGFLKIGEELQVSTGVLAGVALEMLEHVRIAWNGGSRVVRIAETPGAVATPYTFDILALPPFVPSDQNIVFPLRRDQILLWDTVKYFSFENPHQVGDMTADLLNWYLEGRRRDELVGVMENGSDSIDTFSIDFLSIQNQHEQMDLR